MKNRVFNLADRIEDKTNKMVHEIPELAVKFKTWQDGKAKDSYIIETFNKYIDKLNKEN